MKCTAVASLQAVSSHVSAVLLLISDCYFLLADEQLVLQDVPRGCR